MTIEEMQNAKNQVEAKIQVILNEFAEQSGLKISALDLDRLHVCVMGEHRRYVYAVKMKVEL